MKIEMQSLTHKMQRAAVGKLVDAVLAHAASDRAGTVSQLVDVAQQFWGDSYSPEVYDQARAALSDPEGKWPKLIDCVLGQLDPHVARTTALNLGYEAFFRGTKTIRENRVRYQCNIPWLILFDPTSACNMHCTGCWAGEYGHKNNLSFEDMDRIVSQGKELGVYLYMLTGGEPLVRKADVLRLAEKHNDVQFAIYTNSTLIDDAFCEEVARLGNIAFMLSIEGSPETNDARRGSGHYTAVMDAMDRLRTHGILFGTSICYTSANLEAVTSDRFLRMLSDKGAHFGFYFHYMPVGNDAAPELLPTPEQRRYMIQRIRYLRSAESDIPFFPMDFQNDGQYVGGCIAAAATISISIPPAMQSRVCSSTTRTATSTAPASWRSCAARCSWPTGTASPSTKTICVPAPCWKTRKNCAAWSTRPAHTAPTCNLRSRWIICATSVRTMPMHGRRRQMRSGTLCLTGRAATRITKPGNSF